MATGVVSWSQTAATNATADSAVNWAEGQAPSSVNDSARALMASVAKWRDDQAGSILTTGSATAFAATSNQVFATLAAMSGQSITLRFHVASGTAPTLNVDALGAKPILADAGLAVPVGALNINSIWTATYDNSIPAWIVSGLQFSTFIPAGLIAPFGGSTAPTGWLLCDGASYLRTTAAALFAVIGTTFGSADGTHFNVPDLTGRIPAGKEASATRLTSAVGGVDGGTLGAVGGLQSNTLVAANLAAHVHTGTTDAETQTHTHSLPSAIVGSGSVNENITGGGTNIPVPTPTANLNTLTLGNQSATHTHGFSTAAMAAATAHANVQPTIVVNYIIKT